MTENMYYLLESRTRFSLCPNVQEKTTQKNIHNTFYTCIYLLHIYYILIPRNSNLFISMTLNSTTNRLNPYNCNNKVLVTDHTGIYI